MLGRARVVEGSRATLVSPRTRERWIVAWEPELEWEAAREAPSAQDVGARGEEIAAAYLEGCGWELLDRNVRWRDGELDLVAGRWEELYGERVWRVIFVEVKTRRRAGRIGPEANMTPKKRRTVATLARLWAKQHRCERCAMRLDVIAVVLGGAEPAITHYEGAFGEGGRL
jgi:putative endonuclease